MAALLKNVISTVTNALIDLQNPRKRKATCCGPDETPKRRKSEDELLIDIRQCFRRNKVEPGDRLTYYRRKLEILREARRQANSELLVARSHARFKLRNLQRGIRSATIASDALTLSNIYNRQIKMNPDDFINSRNKQWDTLENSYKKTWLVLQDIASLSVDVVYTAAKHMELLPDLFTKKSGEKKRKDSKQSSKMPAQQKQERKEQSVLQIKKQNFLKEFKGLRNGVKNACEKMEPALESALVILNEARKEHDLLALERYESTPSRQNPERRKSLQTSQNEIPDEEKAELRMILLREAYKKDDLDAEHHDNIDQLEMERDSDMEVRKRSRQKANEERTVKINSIKIAKEAKYFKMLELQDRYRQVDSVEPETAKGKYGKYLQLFKCNQI